VYVHESKLIGKSEGVVVRSKFIPYGLVVYDSGDKQIYNIKSCNLGDLSWVYEKDICKNGCEKNKESDRLGFDQWVTYLSGWVYAPEDVKVVDYQGRKVYCHIDGLYELFEFETEEGKCYKYPKSYITHVDCCPGLETSNSICGDDFSWHPIVVGECDDDNDCSSGYRCVDNECIREKECDSDFGCYGSGKELCQDLKLTKYGCVSGECIKVKDKDVDCCPPYDGCDSGYVCDPNEGYKCVKQEGPDIVCGDGICTKPYEDMNICPEDCDDAPCVKEGDNVVEGEWCCEGSMKFFGYCRNSILLIASVIGSIILFMKISKDAITKKDWYEVVTNVMITLLAFAGMFVIVMKWKSILVGAGILGVLGGVALYFAGGVILAIAVAAMKIYEVVRGK